VCQPWVDLHRPTLYLAMHSVESDRVEREEVWPSVREFDVAKGGVAEGEIAEKHVAEGAVAEGFMAEEAGPYTRPLSSST